MLQTILETTATTLLARRLGSAEAGAAGAALGLALPLVARRLGPFGMIAMAVGVWGATRLLEAEAARQSTSERSPVTS